MICTQVSLNTDFIVCYFLGNAHKSFLIFIDLFFLVTLHVFDLVLELFFHVFNDCLRIGDDIIGEFIAVIIIFSELIKIYVESLLILTKHFLYSFRRTKSLKILSKHLTEFFINLYFAFKQIRLLLWLKLLDFHYFFRS